MAKISIDNEKTVEKVEEKNALQPFFFATEGRTIMASSLVEAQEKLNAEQGK